MTTPDRPAIYNHDPMDIEELSNLMSRMMGQPYWGWVRDVVSRLNDTGEMSANQIRTEVKRIAETYRNHPKHDLVCLGVEAALIWLRNENGKPKER